MEALTDETFVPFLKSLGVETCNRSFEWVLEDSDFVGVLKWLYENLDQNNALTAREECRYIELQEKNALLNSEQLESAVALIKEEYEGIPMLGDEESIEDVQLSIANHNKLLALLEKEEGSLECLLDETKNTYETISREITELTSAEKQCKEEEAALSEQSLSLAKIVVELTDSIMELIGDNLNQYTNYQLDKEFSKKFIAFGPMEAYKQSQSLFLSHYDLYTSTRFAKQRCDVADAENFYNSIMEFQATKERLYSTICMHIDVESQLAGEKDKLNLIINYEEPHPNQIPVIILETKNDLKDLEQQETILDQEIDIYSKKFVDNLWNKLNEVAAKSILDVRKSLYEALNFLHDVCRSSWALDRVLYYLLRMEFHTAEDFLAFAKELMDFVKVEADASKDRIEIMNDIHTVQVQAERKLETQDVLAKSLFAIFGGKCSSDVTSLVRLNANLQRDMEELNEQIKERFSKREERWKNTKESQSDLISSVWDGCTKQPNCHERAVAALDHKFKQQLEKAEACVLDTTSRFTAAKNSNKTQDKLRKLWQLFLTNEDEFKKVIKDAQFKSYY